MNDIKYFYSQNHFPGPYSIDQLKKYDIDANRYIKLIDQYITNKSRVLDIGCGTGLLTNLFALNYSSTFLGIDFSTAADYANKFAIDNHINNASFVKQDFFKFKTKDKFNIIIAQSFLTHVPDYEQAVAKIKQLLAPNGVIILGMFHPAGKLIKNKFKVNYGSDRLQLDQKFNPFEQAFSKSQVIKMFKEYELLKITPSLGNHLVWLMNLANAKNGGLTMYVFKDSKHGH